MNTLNFVQNLRDIAEELKPLATPFSSSSAAWDGESYVKQVKNQPIKMRASGGVCSQQLLN